MKLFEKKESRYRNSHMMAVAETGERREKYFVGEVLKLNTLMLIENLIDVRLASFVSSQMSPLCFLMHYRG